MENKELVDKISQDIKKSKKYRSVYDKTIERIVGDFAIKNSTGNRLRQGFGVSMEKKSKNLLHQIWGAFYASRPDFSKLLHNLAQNYAELNAESRGNKNLKEIILPILNLQSSVKERIPILDTFYKKIFAITGVPNSIIDYACGLNPLTYFWMNVPETTQYQAFDIDEDEVDFLNSVFKFLKIKNVKINLGDVLVDELEYADVVFLFKLLPCLEHQKKDSGIELIKNLQCKYVVVSFPIKSLGGRKVGMVDFYSNNFKKMVEREGWKAGEFLFDTELVFVIKK